jgi:hypothetical protein
MAQARVTVSANICGLLSHRKLCHTLAITSEMGDRFFAWPTSVEFLHFMIENSWNLDISLAAGVFHSTQYSIREQGGVNPAMQVCLHPTKDGAWPYFFEIDFDYVRPSGGVKSFLIQTGEAESGWHRCLPGL